MENQHLRVRGNLNNDINVEHFIQTLEKQYKIDFRSLPQWKELIKLLHVPTTAYEQKIQDHNRRKAIIIDKIYVQWCRPSPFELTDRLARTANKWHKLETAVKRRKISLTSIAETISRVGLEEELSEFSETVHQNTEIVPSEEHVNATLKDVENDDVKLSESQPSPRLPAYYISTNQHKLVSPIDSENSGLSYKTFPPNHELNSELETNEWKLLNQTTSITCSLDEIVIHENTLKEQSIKFSMTNCSTEYMNIRFKCVTEVAPFRKTNILPVTPLKLYPGMTAKFTFVFTLLQNVEEFTSNLYFRVGRNVLFAAPMEAFLIPITSKFKVSPSVSISETVAISPFYLWHVSNKPKGFVTISVNDKNDYNLRIRKRVIDFTRQCDSSLLSMEVVAPNTESFLQRTEDHEMESQSNFWSTSSGDLRGQAESITTIDFIGLVVNEVLELALDPFIFECTYLHLKAHSNRIVSVLFSKALYIGKHQSYYDFELSDPESDNVVLTKSIKIFAEILPHPIIICPKILDMSNSPVTHGFCEDGFVVTNSHKLYSATLKIKSTTKMEKLFQVTPTEATIPANSSVYFTVKFCSRDFKVIEKRNDLVHFTIKIIVLGHKSIYYKAPPFYYEIIAPCAVEFKKIYSHKYFKEVTEKSQIEIENAGQMFQTSNVKL